MMIHPEFFKKVLNLIPDISSTNLIIVGDFNLVLDTYLDRSSSQRVEPSKAYNLLYGSYIENTPFTLKYIRSLPG